MNRKIHYTWGVKILNWIIIGILSVLLSTLNILRVIVGIFQTPPGFEYLWIGHYYMDFFEYAQQIAQGGFGHWLVENQFTPSDPTRTLLGWGQYLIIGKVGGLFHFSPFFSYWLSVFLFSIILCFVFFILIKKLMPKESYFLQVSAFLCSLLAVPFSKILFDSGKITIIPYDFWYAPISIYHRIGGIPHHITSTIGILLILLLTGNVLSQLMTNTWRKLIPQIAGILILTLLLLTFAPLQIINLLSSVTVVVCFYIGKEYFQKKSIYKTKKLLFFLIALGGCIIPAALLMKLSHGSSPLFKLTSAWEMSQEYHPPVILLLATIGPLVLAIPFGIRTYFRTLSPIKLLVFFFICFSYFYYTTPLARIFGTFNPRFLTPISYIGFSVCAILGLKNISNKFPHQRIIFSSILCVFILYCIGITLVIQQSIGLPSNGNYQPKELFTGIKTLRQMPNTKAVLTSPAISLGMIVPILVDRNVYLGRTMFTPNFEERGIISDSFYSGALSEKDAKQLCIDNTIGYVLLAFSEPYDVKTLEKYTFLKEYFRNEAIIIFQVLE